MAHRDRVEQARQAWNAGDLDGYLTMYDETVQLHGYSPAPMDKATVTGFYQGIWAAFAAGGKPNPELEFHEVLEQGDLYCCRFTMSGIHQGEFLGVPATGRGYALAGMTILRFGPAGTLVERWSVADFLGLLMQLGAFPPPPPA